MLYKHVVSPDVSSRLDQLDIKAEPEEAAVVDPFAEDESDEDMKKKKKGKKGKQQNNAQNHGMESQEFLEMTGTIIIRQIIQEGINIFGLKYIGSEMVYRLISLLTKTVTHDVPIDYYRLIKLSIDLNCFYR